MKVSDFDPGTEESKDRREPVASVFSARRVMNV